MAETVTGTTVGDVKCVVAYLDVNTNNLYDANGQLYGNNTLATFLDNEFTLELHYVQDISTSSNPEEWAVWDGLKDLTVSSTLAFDDNYLHAVRGTIVADASAGSPSVFVDVTDEINKDTLSRYGVLLVNPFGDEEDQLMIPYSSFQQVSGTTFSFIVDDAQGLEASVTKDTPVRVSDPLYMFINVNDVYEANIPNRYEEGVFKFPVNAMSRKLLNALDYSGSTGVSGTMEHKIYINKTVISKIGVAGNLDNICVRRQDSDEVASLQELVGFKVTGIADTIYKHIESSDRENDGTMYYAWGVEDSVSYLTKTLSITTSTTLYDEMYYTATSDTISEVVYAQNPYLFCSWIDEGDIDVASPTPVCYTKGNDVHEGETIYGITGGTANAISGSTAYPMYALEQVLFRTFAFPFIVRNLVDYGVSLTIPVEDIDWTKEYVISIIRNNMEVITGKASQGAYGVVMIANDGTIDVNDGVISIATSLATKQDNMSATIPVNINNSTVSLNIGDGLDVGVTGTTNANKLIVNEASVKEVLEDIVDGGTEPAVNEIVTADNLRGALSVGQAVDVSCPIQANNAGYQYSTDGTNWYDLSLMRTAPSSAFLNDFYIRLVNAPVAAGNEWFGFFASYGGAFPKAAPGLRYLVICDVCNEGAKAYAIRFPWAGPEGVATGVWGTALDANQTTFHRIAAYMSGDNGLCYILFQPAIANTTIVLHIKNWRQYEVTNLTDEAISYLAQLENPDDFFRSADAYTVLDKYLVKQDMVAPWIPTIGMPDNSDLTVAAGLSYKITYTDNNTHNVTVDTIPTNAYGWDSHIQMFVKGASNVKFKEPLILMDALTSNAGHNLIVKYRNGQALVYVDDLNAGNIVLSTTGSTVGTLNYYLQQNPGTGKENYIIFGAVTDGAVCDASSVSVAYNTNVIGNGTDNTTITGTYGVASGKTMNLQDLNISGSTINGAGKSVFINTIVQDCLFNPSSDNIIMDGAIIPEGSTVTYNGNYTTSNVWNFGSVVVNGVLNGGNKHICATSRDGVIDGLSGRTGIIINDSGYRIVCFGSHTLTVRNVTITGYNFQDGAVNFPYTADGYLENVLFKDNEGSNVGAISLGQYDLSNSSVYANHPVFVTIKGCTFTNNRTTVNALHRAINLSNWARLYIDSCLFDTDNDIWGNCGYADERANQITIQGANVMKNRIFVVDGNGNRRNAYILIHPNTVIDATGNTNTSIIDTLGTTVSDGFMLTTYNGVSANIDGCVCTTIGRDAKFTYLEGTITITGSTVDPWKATNAIFASPIDAYEASTVKLSGTTFTATAKIDREPMRIQLPASSTNSFQGNTNATDTKILEAGLIVVGNNPSSPSGSATIVNASGTSTTVTGIGTYIAKDGSNDFVANNSTNVKAVDASTTGAKYLGTVLSATTGGTGADRFAKIDSGAVAVVNEAVNAVNKQIITHDYEPIIGGTFSLTSATVSDATKTVAIQSGGTMSVVDIRGGKDSVINLGGTQIALGVNPRAEARGCVFTGGAGASAGVFYAPFSGVLNLDSCTLSENTGVGAIYAVNGRVVNLSGCTFSDNSGYSNILLVNASANIRDTVIDDSTTYGIATGGATVSLSGSNTIQNNIVPYGAATGTVSLTSGATLDLTGNDNPTPIAPGGGVVIGSNVQIYPSAGSASAVEISGGTYTAITNGGVLKKFAVSNGETISGNAVVDMSDTIWGAQVYTGSIHGLTFTGFTTSQSTGLFTKYGGGTFTVSDCDFVNNAPSGMAHILYGLVGTLIASSCEFAGGGKSIGVNGGTVGVIDCSNIGYVYLYNGALTMGGSNSIAGNVAEISGSATVIVSSGAIVDLTGNSNATPINPGGGITLYGGVSGNLTAIIGSGGVSRTFEDVTISGTSISNIGAIYGATISDVPTYGYVLTYTTDGGVTSNTHNLNDTAPTDVPGTFGSSAGVLSVVKSNS